MKLYAVSYHIDDTDHHGYLFDFFSTKTDACKRARQICADGNQVFDVLKIRVPTKKADMIKFLNSVSFHAISIGESVPWWVR